MSAWTAFGFGILLGALLFDQLWRWLYRVSGKLIREQGEYIAELEAAIAIEAGTVATVEQGAMRSTKARAEGIAQTTPPSQPRERK